MCSLFKRIPRWWVKILKKIDAILFLIQLKLFAIKLFTNFLISFIVDIFCSNFVHTVAFGVEIKRKKILMKKKKMNHCRMLALVRLRFPMSVSHCNIFRLQFVFCLNLYEAQIQVAHTQALTSATSLSACVHHTLNHLIGVHRPVAKKKSKSKRNRRSLLSSTTFPNCMYFALVKCARLCHYFIFIVFLPSCFSFLLIFVVIRFALFPAETWTMTTTTDTANRSYSFAFFIHHNSCLIWQFG